jgi:hypothetical protein
MQFGSEGPSGSLKTPKNEYSNDDQAGNLSPRTPADHSVEEFDPVHGSTPAFPRHIWFNAPPRRDSSNPTAQPAAPPVTPAAAEPANEAPMAFVTTQGLGVMKGS